MKLDRRNKVGTALSVAAIVLFVAPAIFPVQPILVHDTRPSTSADAAELAEEGIEVIAFENLSEEGQDLYVETLRSGIDHRVPADRGAPEFEYPSPEELDDGESGYMVAIERPADDDHLPPAHEHRLPRGEAENGEEMREMREEANRYDLMRTSEGQPDLGAPQQLIRLAAVMLAVICLGLGGYFLSSK